MTHTFRKYSVVALSIVLCGCGSVDYSAKADFITAATIKSEIEIKYPYMTVEHYSFGMYDSNAETQKASQFSFRWTKGGYSIKVNSTGKSLFKEANYIKTFGALSPTVRIHLIDKRFILVPITNKNSSIPNMIFHDMEAVIRVYDLKTGKQVGESSPFSYNHNISIDHNKLDLHQLIKESTET